MPPEIKIEVPADVTRETLGFLQGILGPVAEAGDFLSDKVRFWRWKSAMKTIERAQVIAGELNISPATVPLKFLVPFIEKASLEHEDEMTERWARLLVASVQNFDAIHQTYLDILSRISSEEAQILADMYENAQDNFNSGADAQFISEAKVYAPSPEDVPGVNQYGTLVVFNQADFQSEELLERFHDDPAANRLLLLAQGLEMRGLVRVVSRFEDDEEREVASVWAGLTALGLGFVEACERER